MRSAVIISGNGGLVFVLENLITQTYKGNNEDTKLDKIRNCNTHWQPSFLCIKRYLVWKVV